VRPMEEGRSAASSYIHFLGTGGARFTMISQIRATGGIWLSYDGFNFSIDPGPGALVRMKELYPRHDPAALDGLLLSHRHIDHSNDVNVLTLAMTGGGRQKNGTVVLPEDAMTGNEPILFRFLRSKVAHLTTWENGKAIALPGKASVEGVRLIHHGVDCFGFVFRHPFVPTWGLISDTRMHESLAHRFRECELLVVNVTFEKPRPGIDHLSISDVECLLDELHPRMLVLTHLGRGLSEADPRALESRLSTARTSVIVACDGMVVELSDLSLKEPAITASAKKGDDCP